MSRLLSDLDPDFLPQAAMFLAYLAEAGIPVLIVTTGRTEAEQADAVARRVSWTMKSKHLPQPPFGKSKALDVVPFETF